MITIYVHFQNPLEKVLIKRNRSGESLFKCFIVGGKSVGFKLGKHYVLELVVQGFPRICLRVRHQE